MSARQKGDGFSSDGGNMNVAKDRGTAIQVNELHLHQALCERNKKI